MNADEKCGAFGCTLPAGHNRGRADVPENHLIPDRLRQPQDAREAQIERLRANNASDHQWISDTGQMAAYAKARFGESEMAARRRLLSSVFDRTDLLDRVAELVAVNATYREALEVATDLLIGEGYDRDPDYRQEWQTITDALASGDTDT